MNPQNNPLTIIRNSSDFILEKGVYRLESFNPPLKFEEYYLKLRNAERRNYDDETLSHLPYITHSHKHYKEWQIRKNSSDKLKHYLSQKSHNINILEIGCGNGWLANKIAQLKNANVIGMDINLTELEQAARVFKSKDNLIFLHADIFSEKLDNLKFNCIILSAAIQYFKDLTVLVQRLLELTVHGGEIHIIDSPLYCKKETQTAKNTSYNHFKEMDVPEMSSLYFHHMMVELANFKFIIMFKPDSLFNRARRRLFSGNLPPFYWLKLEKEQSVKY